MRIIEVESCPKCPFRFPKKEEGFVPLHRIGSVKVFCVKLGRYINFVKTFPKACPLKEKP